MPTDEESKSETFKKLLDDIDRKESIITALDQKLIQLTGELEKEREKNREQSDALKSCKTVLAGKESESAMGSKRVEELVEKKNKLQTENGTLREENKKMQQAYGQLEGTCEALKQQLGRQQEESRGKAEELRSALRKNGTLQKQLGVKSGGRSRTLSANTRKWLRASSPRPNA